LTETTMCEFDFVDVRINICLDHDIQYAASSANWCLRWQSAAGADTVSRAGENAAAHNWLAPDLLRRFFFDWRASLARAWRRWRPGVIRVIQFSFKNEII